MCFSSSCSDNGISDNHVITALNLTLLEEFKNTGGEDHMTRSHDQFRLHDPACLPTLNFHPDRPHVIFNVLSGNYFPNAETVIFHNTHREEARVWVILLSLT